MVLFKRMRTIEIPDREKSYGTVMPQVWRDMRAHSTLRWGERRLEKRRASRLEIIGEKVSRVSVFLGRAKKVWRLLRVAV